VNLTSSTDVALVRRDPPLDVRIAELEGQVGVVGAESVVLQAENQEREARQVEGEQEFAELPPNVLKIIADEHRAALTKFLDTHAVLGGKRHLYQGLAHDSLQKAAAEHAADFVVMGAVARRGLKRLFIGSTAERVLDRLPCDLVIIKPLEFEVPGDVD